MNFDFLPDLVLHRMFSFFDLVERSRLKLVCKRWLFFLQACEQGRTLVIHKPKARFGAKWPRFVKRMSSDVCEVTRKEDNEIGSCLVGNPALEHKQLDRI